MSINSMIIWVLKENNSAEFYEKLGGVKVVEKDYIIDSKTLRIVGYGWADLNIKNKQNSVKG